MIETFTILIVTAVLLAVLIAWRRRHFSYFEDLGVPGPKPNLIWGNLWEYYQHDRYNVIGKWLKKYGDVFGFYNGDVPFLVVNDLEFLEYVFVRNFRNFVDRGLTMLTDQMHPILGKSILHAKGNDWKGIRSSVKYGLSAAKIKMMMPEVCKSADLFLERMEKLANEEVHLYDEYQLLSMDYTARGAFGIDTVFQLEPHHPLLTIAKGVLDGVMTGPLHMIAQCTSALGDIMKPFYLLAASFGEFTFKTLGEETSKIVELRRKDPSQKTSVDYEIVTRKLKYLQQVIDESLRLLPPALIFTTRRAKEDFEYNGLRFKAGTCVMSPTYQVHTDSRYWPDPLVFDPDRFSTENEAAIPKMAHQPFGLGPRRCVGMRMALTNIKYTLARILVKFQLELGEKQEGTLQLAGHGMASVPVKGPWIIFRQL